MSTRVIQDLGNKYSIDIERYEYNREASYSKGPTQYENATGITQTAYPTNGKSGDYWYVYKGIQ